MASRPRQRPESRLGSRRRGFEVLVERLARPASVKEQYADRFMTLLVRTDMSGRRGGASRGSRNAGPPAMRNTGAVASASWSADGSRIVTASFDSTAKVWDSRPINRAFLPREPAPRGRSQDDTFVRVVIGAEVCNEAP